MTSDTTGLAIRLSANTVAPRGGETDLAEPARSPAHSARSGEVARVLVVAILVGIFVAVGLLGHRESGAAAPAGADDNAGWTMGP